ncbi:MAG: hypothetical protein KGR42_08205 [Acidobacteria bacterium]|nr:hypothetical protein [Acidobacteriota bacterium]
MQIKRKLRLATVVGAAGAAMALSLVAPSVSGAATAAPSGTLTYAEAPGASPNYIFPFMSCTYFSVNNINQFQQLLYRPLYWFGLGNSAAVVDKPQVGANNPNGLSLAAAPVMSNGNKTVTLNLGNYKFQDGQPVNGQSVQFFLNLYKADVALKKGADYCGYNAGYGIPDQVASVTHTAKTVTIKFTTSVNPNWILYNYLSEITPLPNTWDTIGAGQEGCATGAYGAAKTDSKCIADLKSLQAKALNLSSYSNSFWQSGVTGPYTVTHFDTLGNVTLVPNKTYMGPQPSQVAVVKEIPFATSTAEENALRAGSVDLGYVDPSVLTSSSPGPLKTGANWGPVANRYNLVTGSSWGFSYAAYNFQSGSPEAKFLNQLYIRQALQEGVNQAGIIAKLDKGYGLVNYSPLPYGISPTLGHQPKQLYPYNLTAAKALLAGHGWTMSGGSLTCTNPGTGKSQCGPGINKGDVLTITYLYGGGTPSFTAEVNTIVSAWQSLGIKATATPEPFNQVIADCAAGKTTWSVCDWGAGWIYAPDYFPSGEWGFTPGAGFNIGAYNNPTMTSIIKTTTFGTAKLSQYASYFEQQLPVMFQPNGERTGEIIKTLKSTIGFAPNPLQNFNPEYFHF